MLVIGPYAMPLELGSKACDDMHRLRCLAADHILYRREWLDSLVNKTAFGVAEEIGVCVSLLVDLTDCRAAFSQANEGFGESERCVDCDRRVSGRYRIVKFAKRHQRAQEISG